MGKKYNVGIVGYGWVASAHIPAINATQQAQVTAVCSSRELDPKELSSRHGGSIRCYKKIEDILADSSLDAISICSYPYQHAAHAVAAAKAGKHLIIEKPLALTLEDCQSIKEAASAANVQTCVCFECRYSSQFVATRAVIEQGLLGTIHYGEVDYYHGIGPWYGQFRWNIRKDAGGSALLSAGCHALDALLLCMGTDVAEVSSYATKSANEAMAAYEYPSTSVTLLKFRDGRIGKCTACIDCLQPYYFHTHLVGSHGSLLDNKFHSTKLETNKQQWSTLSMKMLDSGDVSDHPYESQFQAFFNALERGEKMPLTNMDDACRTHEILFAADRSAAEGKPVSIA